jgi:signal transduction histidine kinase
LDSPGYPIGVVMSESDSFFLDRDLTRSKIIMPGKTLLEELRLANKELVYQNEEKEKRAAELVIANKELAYQNLEKEKRAAELDVANIELAYQNTEKEKRAEELVLANRQLEIQNQLKEKRAAELVVANEELAFQNHEKEKRAAELELANIELAYQNEEKEKRAAELVVANKELAYQNDLKEKRANELNIANKELAFQNEVKEKRAAELITANNELAFQNHEKEKRAAELVIANIELAYQNREKEKRAAELAVANKELAFQNELKEKRAKELVIANKELAYQNNEKEKRAGELVIANLELAHQNLEKERRAEELILANQELAIQNEAKEKRAAELITANEELEAFAYVSSHDMQEPLRKIQSFIDVLLEKEQENLSEKGKSIFKRIEIATQRMRMLIQDLYTYSRVNVTERIFVETDLNTIVNEVRSDLANIIQEKQATIEVCKMCKAEIIVFQFRQLIYNLLQNSLKFSRPGFLPKIVITSQMESGDRLNYDQLSADTTYCHITITDNGIGFQQQYSDKIFKVFQRLHNKEDYEGTGMGLAIVKKIVDAHSGIITAASNVNEGARFDIYLPSINNAVD